MKLKLVTEGLTCPFNNNVIQEYEFYRHEKLSKQNSTIYKITLA